MTHPRPDTGAPVASGPGGTMTARQLADALAAEWRRVAAGWQDIADRETAPAPLRNLADREAAAARLLADSYTEPVPLDHCPDYGCSASTSLRSGSVHPHPFRTFDGITTGGLCPASNRRPERVDLRRRA